MKGDLTARECEILRLRAHGMEYGLIAERLRISPRTLGRWMDGAQSKLRTGNPTATVLKAWRDGWIDVRREGLVVRPLRPLELEALWGIVRHGTIRNAAAHMFLSPYSVSHRLTDIRRALGAPERLPLEALAARAAVFGQLSLKGNL